MSEGGENTLPRRGPSPLPVHIGLALSEYAKVQRDGSVPQQELERMMQGIRKYQAHPFRRQAVPLQVVLQEGETRVFYCAAKNPLASLLLVPSLINKSSILDLLPEKTFLRWLAGQGIDTYLLDWGHPLKDRALHDMDSLVSERLAPAIEKIAAHAGTKIHALGYCMGGTLLATASLFKQEFLRSIVFLASPWDFHGGDRKLSDQVRLGTSSALQMIETSDSLPMEWIQSVFAAVNAGRALEKFSDFAALDDDSEKARLFVSVEDWLNDGVDLPRSLARTCIMDWYNDNRPGKNEWKVAGQLVDLSALNVPALVMASANDRLVPRESSLAMAEILPQVTTMEPSSGHIGMMTGRKAEPEVWRPIADWITQAS